MQSAHRLFHSSQLRWQPVISIFLFISVSHCYCDIAANDYWLVSTFDSVAKAKFLHFDCHFCPVDDWCWRSMLLGAIKVLLDMLTASLSSWTRKSMMLTALVSIQMYFFRGKGKWWRSQRAPSEAWIAGAPRGRSMGTVCPPRCEVFEILQATMYILVIVGVVWGRRDTLRVVFFLGVITSLAPPLGLNSFTCKVR